MRNSASRPNSGNSVAGESRARALRRSSRKKRIKNALAVIFLIVESAIAIVLVIAVTVFWKFSNELPRIEDLREEVRPPVATTIWSEDGVLLGQLQVINRQPVMFKEIPKSMINATVAIEDRRFFEHHGVDFPGIARATLANLSGSNATRQGASTLTQQLVRNLNAFGLTKEKKFSRKIREALTAMRLEQLYSKSEILSLYLNNIYYGSGAYGVQAASKTYFNKDVGDLKLAEVALIAGLAQRPSSFTPYEHRKAALKRRDEVLDNMLKNHYITQAEMEEAKSTPLVLVGMKKHKDYDFKAPYFVWYVLNDLARRYGTDYVYRGLKIETSLNWNLQKMAEENLEAGLASHAQEASEGHGPNQGAMVSLDNNSGYIRAMVGGRRYRDSQYNNVTQGRRQPGSTFKLFDYVAAFDTGTCELDSSFPDKPIPYPNDPEGRIVHNFAGEGGYSYREVSCKEAIQFSKNTVAVQVAAKVGIKKVIDYAHKMGITTSLQPYLPTALGASEVHPLDLASAYSIIALKGNRYKPMALVRVTDSEGNIVEENIPSLQTDILKQRTVEQINEALEAVVMAGTGTHARDDGKGHIVENAHGKTGTTSDSRDAWFAGYTPELTTVIWVAQVHHYDVRHPRTPTYVSMGGVTGGAVCAPIWHDFMFKAVPEERKFHVPGIPQIAVAPETEKKDDKGHATTASARTNANKEAAKPADKPAGDGATPQKPAFSPIDAAPPGDETAHPLPVPNGETTPPVVTAAPDIRSPRVAPSDPRPTLPPPVPAAGTPVAPPRNVTSITSGHAGGQKPETTATASSSSSNRNAPTRVAPPRADLPPVPEMVDVSVCVDSGERAAPWCTAVHTVHITKREAARLRRCRTHKPPPGEG